MESKGWVRYGLLIVLVVFLFFLNLGKWDLWNPDEPRYAEIAREMLISGDWILPRLNGEVYFDKPPLFFWLIAFSAKVWGELTSFSARFPSALFASLTVLLIFFFGKRVFNQRVGLFAALILATNVEFFWLARRANIDATLTFFTTLTIFSFYFGFLQPNHRFCFYFIGFLSMGIGFLTKLQVAIVVPGLTILTFLVATKNYKFLKDLRFFLTSPVFFLVVFSWLIAAYQLGGKEYMAQLLYHKTGAIFFEKVSHPRPFYYYFKNFPGDFFPWFLFFPSALILAFKRSYRSRPEIVLLLGRFITNFIFFSLAKGKRELYLLPTYPAASLLVAFLWNEYLSHSNEKFIQRLIKIPLHILLGTMTISAISLPFIVEYKFSSLLSNSVFLTIPMSLLILGGVAYGYYARNIYPERPLFVIAGIMFLLFLYGTTFIFPLINPFKSSRPLSKKIVKIVKRADKLSFFGFEGADFNYYTGFINVKRFGRLEGLEKFFQSPQQVFCLIQSKAFKWIQENTGYIKAFWYTRTHNEFYPIVRDINKFNIKLSVIPIIGKLKICKNPLMRLFTLLHPYEICRECHYSKEIKSSIGFSYN